MDLSSKLSFKRTCCMKENVKQHSGQYQVKLKEEILETHNRLSFVIIFKGGECLDVFINSKGRGGVENTVFIDVKGFQE